MPNLLHIGPEQAVVVAVGMAIAILHRLKQQEMLPAEVQPEAQEVRVVL